MDDGSKDNTTKIGFEYINKYGLDVIRILKQGVNQGKGAAVRKVMPCASVLLILKSLRKKYSVVMVYLSDSHLTIGTDVKLGLSLIYHSYPSKMRRNFSNFMCSFQFCVE